MKKFVDVSKHVKWVGVVDQDIKTFHGEELELSNGTSYNSYLIRDEKIVLVDTVIQKYSREWLQELKEEIDLDTIDYIVMNHNEPDHSGALKDLMKEIPSTPIYCTAKGKEIIQAYHNIDAEFRIVKTGDTLELGETNLTFVEMKMLHWPDSMASYLSQDNILFSNDAFGQHYGANALFNDECDQEILWDESLKYYACILTPFSAMIKRKIDEILSFNLTIDQICTSHGVIWRKNPLEIVTKYMEWCQDYKEDQVTIVYDTMWETTRKMAESMADGIRSKSPSTHIMLMNACKYSETEILTEIFKSKGVLFGSPTINNRILPSMAAVLEGVKGINFKGKSVGSFGSYGWNCRSVGIINDLLNTTALTVVNDGLKVNWNLNKDSKEICFEYGADFVEQI